MWHQFGYMESRLARWEAVVHLLPFGSQAMAGKTASQRRSGSKVLENPEAQQPEQQLTFRWNNCGRNCQSRVCVVLLTLVEMLTRCSSSLIIDDSSKVTIQGLTVRSSTTVQSANLWMLLREFIFEPWSFHISYAFFLSLPMLQSVRDCSVEPTLADREISLREAFAVIKG